MSKFHHGYQPDFVNVHTDIYNDAVKVIKKLEQENKQLNKIKPLLVTIYDYLNIENEGVNKTEQDICFKIKEILDKV